MNRAFVLYLFAFICFSLKLLISFYIILVVLFPTAERKLGSRPTYFAPSFRRDQNHRYDLEFLQSYNQAMAYNLVALASNLLAMASLMASNQCYDVEFLQPIMKSQHIIITTSLRFQIQCPLSNLK